MLFANKQGRDHGSGGSTRIGIRSLPAVKQRFRLSFDEGEKVGVDLILMRGRETVRRTRIIDDLGALDQPRRLHRRVLDRNDLVILAVQDQRRYVERLEVLGPARA